MKTILLILLTVNLLAETTFYSLGMLPENYSFVCQDGNKWLQYKTDSEVVLEQLFYEDEETGEVLPVKCN